MALAKRARSRETITLNDVFEAERGLVGLILADPPTYQVIALFLSDEDWTHPLHRGVFEVAGELAAANSAITLDAVLPRVADVGPDGAPAEDYLAAHPGVRRRVPGAVVHAYRRARIEAAGETGLDESAFPAACPYSDAAIMTRPIPWPPEPKAA